MLSHNHQECHKVTLVDFFISHYHTISKKKKKKVTSVDIVA